MLTGILLLLCSSLSSVAIAHGLRQATKHSLSAIHLLTVNYLIASIAAMVMSGGAEMQWPVPLWIQAIGTGGLFIATFFVYHLAVSEAGVGLSIFFMRLSMFFPVLLALFYFNESSSMMKWMGFGMLVPAIWLSSFSTSQHSEKKKGMAILLLLMCSSGLGDASMSWFQKSYSSYSEAHFLFVIFASACVVGVVLSIQKGLQFFTKSTILWGTFVGLANLLSGFFLIRGLHHLDASVAFPMVNILVILLGLLWGGWYWREHFAYKQWLGILLALISIIIISNG